MKHLIYFLLFSTVVFSQNYNYAIDEPKKTTVPALPVVNNQLEEIEYFKAYLLPITKKATLQSALDTYGSVRLEKGDYSGVNIVMHSNQRLYGHPSLTKISNITIAAGSSNVVLEYLMPSDSFITFQAGGVISSCKLKSLKYCTVRATNAMLESNVLINVEGQINFDCSQSGYFRNNKIVKHKAQIPIYNLIMKGNSTTPSYGNVNLHSNYLNPSGDTTDINGLQSATFVGLDSEAWNMTGIGTKEMFVAKNMGNLKITDLSGDNGYSQLKTPAYNIDADNLFILNKTIGSNNTSTISLKTNAFIAGSTEASPRIAGVATGFDLLAHINSTNITYNGTAQTTSITDPTAIAKISSAILGTKYTPWDRPTWETLPNPLGANWKTNRVGKTDQTAYIQNLINTKGVAELPEGIFYIGSTLNIHLDGAHGIIGQGTGKTVIVGLTDDFPLLKLDVGTDSNFILANLTLQGGSVGLYVGRDSNGVGIGQIAYQNIKYVTFRDQTYGIQLHQITGLDNNFFEYLGFVNCSKGIFQDPRLPYVDLETSSYIDKTMFYKCQFINNNIDMSMVATRANNLNLWLDCKFSGGSSALVLGSNNNPIIANCDFSGYTGTNVISTNSISLYNSNFYNNSISESTIRSVVTYIEGCNFSDSSNLFTPVLYNPVNSFIFNSTVTGNAIPTIPPAKGYGTYSSVLSNSSFLSNTSLSKLLVNVKDGVPIVVINAASNPYPQLLVTQ
jgi:hypothetical protein